ncbi:PIN domain-containing protein [Streptomyces sp. NPDC093223]|uniref:PIN domain-containing protein n=1 Tax=Streptomyces sp. NPDC093223 TaxID=3366033 RepID=UPI00381A111C
MIPAQLTVLDSSAMLACVLGEEGADFVVPLLPGAAIAAPNFAEIATVALRRGYRDPLQLRQELSALGVTFESTTAEQAGRAATHIRMSHQVRGDHGGRTLALGDALCIALGEHLHRPVITADTLWKDLEDRFTVPVHLIR